MDIFSGPVRNNPAVSSCRAESDVNEGGLLPQGAFNPWDSG